MKFEFATAGRIIFGVGALEGIGRLAQPLGRHFLVVCGADVTRTQPLLDRLAQAGLAATLYSVAGEPTVAQVQRGVDQARRAGVDGVIGMGGGAALDAGKAIAALLTNPGDPFDYLEVIGRGQPLTKPSLPTIAVPTTAGAGAEVTKNAVLASPEHRLKVSLRSNHLLPAIALVDPELTCSMARSVTASTGLDALTQCLEPFVSHLATPLTDGFCREGLRRAGRSLRRAWENGQEIAAREEMCIASLCGGLALANAKLGAVHGFAGVLGGMATAPHGAICARLLPLVAAANVAALQERAPESPALARYAEAARLLTGDEQADFQSGVAWLHELCRDLSVASLGSFGLTEVEIPTVVAQSRRASSMQGNPIVLTDEELTAVLLQAL